jgi:uncharacterized membrane protein
MIAASTTAIVGIVILGIAILILLYVMFGRGRGSRKS